ncbi:MAG: ABC transporter [Deltaproteobacteria bacterium RIFOXYA12_FULL_58_15]|nr:MAG: ABC transporter [Deltaproteobacteria bacterium RIFOXYA12_FULL_58_15]OGR15228.1 MAG: ABC transporter [Deltaproteobacteria bacterium RIFOXYB12_FULL_58_9]
MIHVEGLQKSFGDVAAVQDISFTANNGAITGLLGPNGAGKTTTLRILSTLLRPDHGFASVDGCDVATDPLGVLRKLGVLPESRGLYARLTPREHVRYFGELHGLEGDELDSRIRSLFELLEMEEIADRRVEGFSLGERTKVAIARALVHGPQTIVFDEPTSGLDVMSTRAMRELIRKLASGGACILLSTHVMQEVAALCDEVVVVTGGRVAACGTCEELCAQTSEENIEEAFVSIIGSGRGLR